MKDRSRRRLLLLAPFLLLAGCGVPISAADLALTPEAEPTSVEVVFEQTSLSSRAADLSALQAQRALTTPGPLTTQAAITPLPSATASAASLTPTATIVATMTPTPTGTPPTATPTPDVSSLVASAVDSLNRYRTGSGRSALRADPALMAAAAAYAKQMGDAFWFSCGCDFHTGPDGSQPEQRIARAGYTGRFAGEAIAGGQASGSEAVVAWLNSPSHAAISLDPAAIDVGIGYYYNPRDFYGHYWVLVTGRR